MEKSGIVRRKPTTIASTSLKPGLRVLRYPSMVNLRFWCRAQFVYKNARFVVKFRAKQGIGGSALDAWRTRGSYPEGVFRWVLRSAWELRADVQSPGQPSNNEARLTLRRRFASFAQASRSSLSIATAVSISSSLRVLPVS